MKLRKFIKSCMAVFAALTMTVLAAGSVFAADDVGPNTIITGPKEETGRLTIYKYDITAAEEAGVTGYEKDGTGEADEQVQDDLGDYALAGVQFSYLRVSDISMETVAGTDAAAATVKMVYTITTELENELGLNDAQKKSDHKYTGDELNTFLSAAVGDASKKNVIENYVKDKGEPMDKTDDTGKTSKSGLEIGLYLVAETEVPEEVVSTTDPFFVSIPMTDVSGDDAGDRWNYDVTVYPKNQTSVPTIDKLVRQDSDNFANITSASIGDALDYRIVSELPKITTETTYLKTYTFVDSASSGVDYNKDVDVTVGLYKYKTKDEAGKAVKASTLGTADITLTKGTDYTVTYDDAKNTMTITFLEGNHENDTTEGLEKVNPAGSEMYMVISYQGTVSDSAVLGDAGNDNNVSLTYSRTSESYKEVISDTSRVYTYGINLTKNLESAVIGTDKASQVEFTLEREVTADGNTSYVPVKASLGDDKIYTVSPAGTISEYSPLNGGVLSIRGLEAGTYRITETKTVSGYVLLKDPIEVTITASEVTITPSMATRTGKENLNSKVTIGDTTGATAAVNGKAATMDSDGDTSANASVKMTVTNTKGFNLPNTGGWGTIVFTLIGAAGLAAGTIIVIRKRKSTH